MVPVILLLIAGFAVIEIPRLFLWNTKDVSGYELGAAVPWGGDMRWAYPVLSLIWFVIMAAIHIAAFNSLQLSIGKLAYSLAGSFLGSYAVFEGMFAILTGVISTSTRFAFRYVYENSPRNRRLGLLELSAGLAVIVATIISMSYAMR